MKSYRVTLRNKKGYYYEYMQFANSSKQAKEIAREKLENGNRTEDKIISARVIK